jgi:hypothetical protein
LEWILQFPAYVTTKDADKDEELYEEDIVESKIVDEELQNTIDAGDK